MSDILAVQAVLQSHDPLGHCCTLGTHGKLLEVTGDTRWLLGDIRKLLGGYWEVTGCDCSPSSHLCLSMDLDIEETVLTLKDGLRGAPQHLNLQTMGQGPAQRDSLSCWLEGPLQALQHLGREGRTLGTVHSSARVQPMATSVGLPWGPMECVG